MIASGNIFVKVFELSGNILHTIRTLASSLTLLWKPATLHYVCYMTM